MYRTYRKIPDSFQEGFEFLLKKWYIFEEFLPILQLISWSLPDDEGGITCMPIFLQSYFFMQMSNVSTMCKHNIKLFLSRTVGGIKRPMSILLKLQEKMSKFSYKGHRISSDNGLISPKQCTRGPMVL